MVKVFGTKLPKKNKRNNLIQKAVKKAVKEYRQTFIRLASN